MNVLLHVINTVIFIDGFALLTNKKVTCFTQTNVIYLLCVFLLKMILFLNQN